MTDRAGIDRLLQDLYAARVRGDLGAVCQIFSKDAKFRIAGASHASPIAVTAVGVDEYRPLLALMIKTFKLRDQSINSILIDGTRAAAYWQAKVHSRITGTTVLTELIDLVEVRDDHITSYIEFFVPHKD